jgi:hypothetical protein
MPAINHPAEAAVCVNALSGQLLALLQVEQALSEYQLMQALNWQGMPLLNGDNGLVLLFKKHFLLMHCLYALQSYYAEQGLCLQISALTIVLLPQAKGHALAQHTAGEASVAAFYADLSPLQEATEASCQQWLDAFWQRYHQHNHRADHCAVLGLPADASWSLVQQQYRRLVQQQHPDKGGDTAEFLRIQAAYEALKPPHTSPR